MKNIEKLADLAIRAGIAGGVEVLRVYERPAEVWRKQDTSPVTEADLRSHRAIVEVLKESRITVISEEGKLPPSKRRGKKRFWLVDPLDGTREFLDRNGEFCVLVAYIEEGRPQIGVLYIPITDVLYVAVRPLGQVFRIRGARYLQPLAQSYGDWEASSEPFRREARYGDSSLQVAVSRSHLDKLTASFVDRLSEHVLNVHVYPRGSAIKFLDVARHRADLYPRMAPTHVWDVAAGMLFVEMMGGVIDTPVGLEIVSDKEKEILPGFIAWANERVRTQVLHALGVESLEELWRGYLPEALS